MDKGMLSRSFHAKAGRKIPVAINQEKKKGSVKEIKSDHVIK